MRPKCDARLTPAHEFNDGQNYHPTNRCVLFGHHFAAIAGPAPTRGRVSSESGRHLAHEVGMALRISKDAAHHQIGQARSCIRKPGSFGGRSTRAKSRRASSRSSQRA